MMSVKSDDPQKLFLYTNFKVRAERIKATPYVINCADRPTSVARGQGSQIMGAKLATQDLTFVNS